MNIVRFYRRIYHDNWHRVDQRRNLLQDVWLYAKNRTLQPVERALVKRYYSTRWPLVFIVGAPRSGSTMLYQLMAQHLDVGYIANIVARYWLAPLYAVIRHRFRHRPDKQAMLLNSNFGSTDGSDGPHEFGYFWRYWLNILDTDHLTEQELDEVNWQAIRRELYALTGWFQAPLVLKNLNYSTYHIARFAREFPNCRFIYIRRDARYVVQSLLECRVKRYGDRQEWFGTRPRDIADWRDRDPIEQVCYQVRDIEDAIEVALAAIPLSASLVVEYQQLVTEPQKEMQRIGAFIGSSIRNPGSLGTLELRSADTFRIPQTELEMLDRYFGEGNAAS